MKRFVLSVLLLGMLAGCWSDLTDQRKTAAMEAVWCAVKEGEISGSEQFRKDGRVLLRGQRPAKEGSETSRYGLALAVVDDAMIRDSALRAGVSTWYLSVEGVREVSATALEVDVGSRSCGVGEEPEGLFGGYEVRTIRVRRSWLGWQCKTLSVMTP